MSNIRLDRADPLVNLLITGDFNAKLSEGVLKKKFPNEEEPFIAFSDHPLLNLRNDVAVSILAEIMSLFFLRQLNGRFKGDDPAQKTFIRNLYGSIIDYILLDIGIWRYIKDFWIQPRTESDHNPCCCSLQNDSQLLVLEEIEVDNGDVHLNHKVIKVDGDFDDLMSNCLKDSETKDLFHVVLEHLPELSPLDRYELLISAYLSYFS